MRNVRAPLALTLALVLLGGMGAGAWQVHHARAEGPMPRVQVIGKAKARVIVERARRKEQWR